MGRHAILSPSGSNRWLECTVSARLEAGYEDVTSSAAAEGTLAHYLAELLLLKQLGRLPEEDYKRELHTVKENDLYDESMFDYCSDYVSFIMETYNTIKKDDPLVMIFTEYELKLTAYIPEGFGTTDTLIVSKQVFHVFDFKYGKGVEVDAEDNSQMKIYGSGALSNFGFIEPPKVVRMTIYQPRLDNISTYEIPTKELLTWAESELKPKAEIAFSGRGEFKPGAHCRFCKFAPICKPKAAYELEIEDEAAYKNVIHLSDDDITNVLDRADGLTNWLKAVSEYALKQALTLNKDWPGYKLVRGRSQRRYTDEKKAAEAITTATDFTTDDIYNMKLKGLTDMTKLLGKDRFNELLSAHIVKPEGKPTLVPETDKREAINSLQQARDDFKD